MPVQRGEQGQKTGQDSPGREDNWAKKEDRHYGVREKEAEEAERETEKEWRTGRECGMTTRSEAKSMYGM